MIHTPANGFDSIPKDMHHGANKGREGEDCEVVNMDANMAGFKILSVLEEGNALSSRLHTVCFSTSKQKYRVTL